MGVDYSAGFAFGWKVSCEERTAMVEAYHEATGNYDIEDCFITIDCYREDSGCIFGTWVSYFPEPGYCRRFDPEMIEIPGKEFFDEYIPMLIYSDRKDLALNVPASLWTVHTVW